MTEPSFADSGASVLEKGVRGLAPGVRVVHTVFRPYPLEPISGRRIFFLTTAPAPALDPMAEHLECEHGGEVVGIFKWWTDRQRLAVDPQAMPSADVLLVELKATAGPRCARRAQAGDEVICDNRPVSTEGDGTCEELAMATADGGLRPVPSSIRMPDS